MDKQPNRLDEMQKEKRNAIGNQMFLVTFCAILFQAWLDRVGITWLPYPANIIILVTVCMGAYLVRTICTNAFWPEKPRRNGIRDMAPSISLGLFAVTLVCVLSARAAFTSGSSNHAAWLVFAVSGLSWLAVLIAFLIRNAKDKNESED